MARIFISHSSRDAEQAQQLKDWLVAKGFERAFLDFDKHTGIAPGADWERTLYRELERAQAVVLLLSRNWFDSKWCFAEFTQARALGKAIFAVVEQPTGETSVVSSDIQHLDLTSGREEGLLRLARELTRVALDAQGGFDWPSGRAPYPGLLAFEAADAAIFFGRDDDVRRAIECVNARRVQGGRKIVAILGGSGAGKSSVLKAGILPRLARDRADYLVAPAFRPGTDPLRGLLQSLRTIDPTLVRGDLENLAAEDALELIDRLRHTASSPQATLIVAVDQAEEIFVRAPAAVRSAFFDVLSALVGGDHPALALFTLRADHLPDLQGAERLTVPFEEFSLIPMPVERLGLVVEGPARVAGLKIEPDLVPALMRDARTHDALPLVAFLLRRLYDRHGSSGTLGLLHYETLRDGALSPLEAAIRDAADEALELAKPSPRELAALREAFVPMLVRVNDDGAFVRQSARLDALPGDAQRLLQRFVDARLLVQVTQEGVRAIEVAHEALFRVWPQLAAWLEEEREFLVGKARIERAREDFSALAEPDRPKGLLAGILLERAKSWLAAYPARFPAEEAAFIRASADEADRLARERIAEGERLREAELARAKAEAQSADTERRRAEERAKAEKRLRNWAIAGALVCAVLGGIAAKLWITADAAEREAERNYRLALDQAAGGVRELVGSYATGAVSTRVLQALIARAQQTVAGLPAERHEVTAARAKLLDALSRADLVLGRTAAARAFAEQARGLSASLSTRMPSERDYRMLLARTRALLGHCLFWQGDLLAALDQLERAREEMTRLLAVRPDDDLQEELLDTIARIGDAHRFEGDADAAAGHYGVWMEKATALATASGHKRWEMSRADAHQRLGDVLLAQRRPAESAEQYRIYRTIAAALIDSDAADMRARRMLSWSHQRMGDARLAQGDLPAATREYETYLDLAAALSNQDPSHFLWHQDFAVAHQRIGEALLKQRELAGALGRFETYLAMTQRMRDKDPSNGTALYDYSNALQKIGDAQREKGDLDAALAAYRQSLAVAEALARRDTSNASWQFILAVSYQRLGITLKARNDVVGAREALQKCLAVPIRGKPFSPRILWPPDVHESCRLEL